MRKAKKKGNEAQKLKPSTPIDKLIGDEEQNKTREERKRKTGSRAPTQL